MVSWQFNSAIAQTSDLIGADTNNNTQATTNVVANADGSVLERLEYLQSAVDVAIAKRVSKTVTFTAAAHEINTAVTIFTVTGTVKAKAFAHVTTAIEADAGNDGTISVGVEDNVAVLLPVITVNETNFAAQDVWADTTTTKQGELEENTGTYVIIANSEQIEINILVEDITAGVAVFYLDYIPISSGAGVVAA